MSSRLGAADARPVVAAHANHKELLRRTLHMLLRLGRVMLPVRVWPSGGRMASSTRSNGTSRSSSSEGRSSPSCRESRSKIGVGWKVPRDEIRDGVGEDHGDDDAVVAADLEDHEHRGHGRAQNSGKKRSHADQRVRPDRNREVGNELALGHADGAADHGAHEERGREQAAGRAAD